MSADTMYTTAYCNSQKCPYRFDGIQLSSDEYQQIMSGQVVPCNVCKKNGRDGVVVLEMPDGV